METSQLHRTQLSILHSLRHTQSERFSDLMRPTNHTSDTFKFHLQKLIKLGYVTKLSDGQYVLTISGKEFANNLDKTSRTSQKQPKLSVLVVASQIDSHDIKRYLFQKRLRNPYWGFWGLISGPIRWGVTPEEAAAHELLKQTGLTATFRVKCFYRKQDYVVHSDTLLEDKQFIIVEASNIQGEVSNAWYGGHNDWLSISELEQHDKFFCDTSSTIRMLDNGETYQLVKAVYDPQHY